MERLRRIDFVTALGHLHGLIGKEVEATVDVHEQFFGCGLQGTLSRVETVPPDHKAIAVVLSERTGLYLDPADTEIYVALDLPESGWLEFRMAFGISVVIERVAAEGGGFAPPR